jgi:hypothetical protein
VQPGVEPKAVAGLYRLSEGESAGMLPRILTKRLRKREIVVQTNEPEVQKNPEQ